MKKTSKNDNNRFSIKGLLLISFLFFMSVIAKAQTDWPQMVSSKDGTLISYEVYGEGDPVLVFVHGWSCDSRYWRDQIPTFSKENKLVLIDLAGHGHSGTTREKYTMKAFGEDVKAVVEKTGNQNVILIGHSMGGAVIAEAARLMPKIVIGLIGIDTYENIEYTLSKEEYNQMITPFKENFQEGTRQFVQYMLVPETDSLLCEWIKSDMSAAPSNIALSALEDYMTQSVTGEAAKIFDEIRVPVITVNSDMWPIDYEANRRHMLSYDAIVIKGADHFLMQARPDEFNSALKQAVNSMLKMKKTK